MSLKDIANKMGYAGPSGVKNLLYIIEDKVKYFASLDEVWFRNMMREFAAAYVEELLDAGGKNLAKRDVQFLSDVLADPDELDVIATEEGFRIWAQEGLNKIYKSKSGKRAQYAEAKTIKRKIKENSSSHDFEDKVKYFASLDKEWFRNMMLEFAKAYIDELLNAGDNNLTNDDIEYLKNALHDKNELSRVTQMPEFRAWAQEGLDKIYKSKSGKRAQ